MVCCCCSCRLKTATLIIGLIFMIISVAYCSILPAAIANGVKQAEKYHEEIDSDTKILIAGLVGFAVLLVTSILLLVGAAMRKRLLLFPWIITFSLGLVIWVVNSVLKISEESMYSGRGGQSLYMAVFFAILAVNVYFLKIVIDYSKELKIEEEQGNKPDDDNLGAENSVALHQLSNKIENGETE